MVDNARMAWHDAGMTILHYDLPDDLHRALKIRAAEEGITLRALVIRLLTEGVARKKEH